MITKMLNLVPLPLSTIQLVAHFFIVGDIVLGIIFILHVCSRLIKYIVVSALMALIICFLVYVISMNTGTSILIQLKN
jgi:hypothetical protein